MERRKRWHFQRVLSQAQMLAYTGRLLPTIHSQHRESERLISMADAEATITAGKARVVDINTGHPEGVTYQIAGRRSNGEELRVVVAFNDEDIEEATELRIITVMYPNEV